MGKATLMDTTEALKILSVLPRSAKADVDTSIDAYHGVLKWHSREAILEGARQVIATEEWFPVPKAFERVVAEVERKNAPPRNRRYAGIPGVVCPTCGSRPRLALLAEKIQRTGETSEYQRYLAPCDPAKHEPGDSMVGLPSQFVRWVEEG